MREPGARVGRMKLLVVAIAAAALLVPAAQAKDPSYCSKSGDVCVAIQHKAGDVYLRITTIAKYFATYKLCVTGPKSKVCKTFKIGPSGQVYGGTVRWSKSFPNQGKGLYTVKWDAAAKALTFRV
jgi:hypothetical protein